MHVPPKLPTSLYIRLHLRLRLRAKNDSPLHYCDYVLHFVLPSALPQTNALRPFRGAFRAGRAIFVFISLPSSKSVLH